MSKTVIILGAKGRFGRAASDAFFRAGWDVRTFARNWPAGSDNDRYTQIEGNAFDPQAVAAASDGCDVIVNALNPPYQNWKRDLPKLTAAVIQAARLSRATIMIPGNVYNYGDEMPQILNEATPRTPTSRKGVLREEMEQAYAVAGDDGIQTIILRGGDFIEQEKTGNWFDSYIAAQADEGVITYPGPVDRQHAWAYLPDMARAMVLLAEKREQLAMFDSFGFEGFSLTGSQLIETIERVTGRRMRTKAMPWRIMRIAGLFIPMIREVIEMQYLWQVPHMIDGSKLSAANPDFQSTPLDIAIGAALPTGQHVQSSNLLSTA